MYHRIKQQLHREASINPVLHGIEGQVADVLIRAGTAAASANETLPVGSGLLSLRGISPAAASYCRNQPEGKNVSDSPCPGL